MSRILELKEKIRHFGMWDLVRFNGPNLPSTPVYSAQEQKEMQIEQLRLMKELQCVENGDIYV